MTAKEVLLVTVKALIAINIILVACVFIDIFKDNRRFKEMKAILDSMPKFYGTQTFD